jgi:hypothetical protein
MVFVLNERTLPFQEAGEQEKERDCANQNKPRTHQISA